MGAGNPDSEQVGWKPGWSSHPPASQVGDSLGGLNPGAGDSGTDRGQPVLGSSGLLGCCRRERASGVRRHSHKSPRLRKSNPGQFLTRRYPLAEEHVFPLSLFVVTNMRERNLSTSFVGARGSVIR